MKDQEAHRIDLRRSSFKFWSVCTNPDALVRNDLPTVWSRYEGPTQPRSAHQSRRKKLKPIQEPALRLTVRGVGLS